MTMNEKIEALSKMDICDSAKICLSDVKYLVSRGDIYYANHRLANCLSYVFGSSIPQGWK